MRIINGKYKNRRFNISKNINIRPTTDRAKESLFNILDNMCNLEKSKVLDLFSGSGNISYEFNSRGSDVTSVELNRKCIKLIKENCENFNMNINIKQNNVFSFLNSCEDSFDIIFADPPFKFTKDKYEKIIKLIFENQIITEHGFVIIEHSNFINFENYEYFLKSKKYGDVNFSFLNK